MAKTRLKFFYIVVIFVRGKKFDDAADERKVVDRLMIG